MPRERAAVVIQTPAKVNLHLEVLGRRPDGYHDLESLLVAVSLHDTLEFWPADGGAVTLTCDRPDLTCGPDNLVLKAAEALRRHSGFTGGAAIHLTKVIPMQAGLGGGSSDAAAALDGLNRLWNLGRKPAELARIGAEIGSDVPFFFAAPAAWCTGRGEIVEPLRPGRELELVIVRPPFGLSTADVFRRVTTPDCPVSGKEMRGAFAAGDVEAIGRLLHNRLQGPAEELCPEVRGVRQTLAAAGPAGCLMTGSGSAVFALCRDRAEAVRVARMTGAVVSGPPPHDGAVNPSPASMAGRGWELHMVRSCV
ncbi:MAG: 4-(cytidine 5'-diphospho)-2-C-methyl-D-erythritol kinase [Gemmataceae bacterium]